MCRFFSGWFDRLVSKDNARMGSVEYGLSAAAAGLFSLPQYYSFAIGLARKHANSPKEDQRAALARYTFGLFSVGFPLATSVVTQLTLSWPELATWWDDVGTQRSIRALIYAVVSALAPMMIPYLAGRDKYGTLAVVALGCGRRRWGNTSVYRQFRANPERGCLLPRAGLTCGHFSCCNCCTHCAGTGAGCEVVCDEHDEGKVRL